MGWPARGFKLNVIGPRGGAKSTLVTLAHVLRVALEQREPYVWIISDTQSQARSHLDNVKLELVENPHLAERHGRAAGRGPVWRAHAIQLANRVRIEAFGVGQRVRGRRRRADRPSLIVCDDLQNDSHMQSARQREHSRRWFQGTLLKAGTRLTNVVNLATALHRDALALELARTPGWISRTFRALERWPDDMALWQQWETIYCRADDPERIERAGKFYEQNRPAMDAGAELLWPEHEDLYTLMRMRVEGGKVAFEREMQGSPANPDLYEWPDEDFANHIWFEVWPGELPVKTLALDPSKGRDDRLGDYSAYVLLGIDAAGVIYVEADLARRPVSQLVADGVEWVRTFRPQAFGVESNQFQELLGDQFAAEFRRQGLRRGGLADRKPRQQASPHPPLGPAVGPASAAVQGRLARHGALGGATARVSGRGPRRRARRSGNGPPPGRSALSAPARRRIGRPLADRASGSREPEWQRPRTFSSEN